MLNYIKNYNSVEPDHASVIDLNGMTADGTNYSNNRLINMQWQFISTCCCGYLHSSINGRNGYGNGLKIPNLKNVI